MTVSSGEDAGLQPTAGTEPWAPEAHSMPIAFLTNELSYFVILKITGKATDLFPSSIYRKHFAESNHCFHQKNH